MTPAELQELRRQLDERLFYKSRWQNEFVVVKRLLIESCRTALEELVAERDDAISERDELVHWNAIHP
jgi:hypothetical protein